MSQSRVAKEQEIHNKNSVIYLGYPDTDADVKHYRAIKIYYDKKFPSELDIIAEPNKMQNNCKNVVKFIGQATATHRTTGELRTALIYEYCDEYGKRRSENYEQF